MSRATDRPTKPNSEAIIVGAVAEWAVTCGYGMPAPVLEVRSHGTARTDVVLLVDDQLIAVEAKRSDWKRAVSQAVLNRYYADQSYVALWEGSISPSVLQTACEFGVGILEVGPTGVSIAAAPSACSPDPELRAKVMQRVTGQVID